MKQLQALIMQSTGVKPVVPMPVVSIIAYAIASTIAIAAVYLLSCEMGAQPAPLLQGNFFG
jgi:hypothetical protein